MIDYNVKQNKQDKYSGLNTQKYLDPFPNSIKVRVKIFLDIETQELREWEKEKTTTTFWKLGNRIPFVLPKH